MIFWTNKSFKETPGSPGDLAQEIYLFLLQGNDTQGNWPINPPYNDWREHPQQQYR